MRLHATAVFWALLAFTAPRGLEAKGLRRKLLATNDCTIMAIEALGLEGNEDPEMIIECELSPEDADGISGISAPIDASPEQLQDLRKMVEDGEIVAGEDTLDIEGDEIDEKKHVKIDPTSNIKAKVQKHPSAKSNKDRRRRLAVTTGDLKMLLVRVTDTNGLVHADNAATMSDEVFGTGDDPVNLKSALEECSFNKLTVVPGLDDPNEVATGVIEVSINVSLEGNSRGTIRNAVTTAVQNKLGHSLPGDYDYVLYSLEKCYQDCGWAAYAYINSWNSVYQGNYYKRPGVLVHELGHNFNLAHSGGLNGATYTDHTCSMGNPHYQDDTFQCFNPAKNFQLDWYDDAKITEDPRTPGYSKTLTLVGVGEYDKRGNSPVTVRLETGASNDYFVGFNRATGPNRLNDEGDDLVTIIQVNSRNGEGYSQSYLRAKLDEDQSYAISNFGGTGKTVTIMVNSIDIGTTPGTAVVTISDGTVTTTPPSVAPTNPPTAPPTNPPTNPSPTSPPTNPPTAPPTLPQPTALPTNQPTPVPTVPSKTLVCGRGDMPTNPCDEGLKRTAPINDINEVRCCRDCTADMNCDLPWKEQCSGFKSGLFARSKFGGVCKTGTFAEAVDFCKANNGRLCTPDEVENSCTKGTGCNFDQHLVWTCAYDGHACSSDDECCGSCNNGTCQGEPTKAPTQVPSPAPTESPTQKPTTQPSNNPTPAPSKSPTSLPTPAPSSPPTNQPSNHPTTFPPTSQPVLSTHAPSPGPTPVPSNPPTSPPTALPTNVVTSAPTSNPTGQPTAQPTHLPTSPPTSNPTGQPTAQPTTSQPTGVASKTLVCGRGDIPTNPCDEGLKRTARIDEIHEVRCCRDCTADMNCDLPWKEKCSGFKPGLFARSKFGGVCKTGTFAEAVDFCRNTGDDNTRLCTPDEVENSCTKGTGCYFDKHLVWTCAYDGHVCSSDDECCGSCENNTCQGENNLIPMETTLQATEVEDRSKYVCSKHRPLDETICEDGDEADDTCSYEGQICGMRENKCWFAACGGNEEVSE